MLTSLQSRNGNHIRAKGGNVLILCLLVNLGNRTTVKKLYTFVKLSFTGLQKNADLKGQHFDMVM